MFMTTINISLPKTNCFLLALLCIAFVQCNTFDHSAGEKILTYAQPGSKKTTVLTSRLLTGLQQIKAPYSVGIADSVLIVLDKSSSKLINLYGLGDYRFLADFGKPGETPWNLSSPWYYGQHLREKDSLYCMIADTKNNRLHKINISNVLSTNGAASLAWSAWLPRAIILGFNSVFLTGDSLLIGSYRGNATASTGRFFRYDIRSGKLDWSGYYPRVEKRVKDEHMPFLYYSFCGFNNEKQLMAASMNLFDRLDIVNTDVTQVVAALPKSSKNYTPSTEELPADRQTKIFFNEVYTTDKFIYALKFDDKLGNYINNTGNMKLCIFSWDGALQQAVELDRAALGKLAVDEKRKKAIIINFCRDRDIAPLVEYDLSTLKIYE
jgi:hypothetical protein